MPSDPLFASMFSTPEMSELVSGPSWVRAMLAFEVALVRASAMAGLGDQRAAEEIAAVDPERLDPAIIGSRAHLSATPVIPFLELLRTQLSPDTAAQTHRGATSQDVLDTAMMLIMRDGLDVLLPRMSTVEQTCRTLATRYREAPMAGRTLMRQAEPITFGLKAAHWLRGVAEARRMLEGIRRERLAIQLGGAVGTLAVLHPHGPTVAAGMSLELGLRAAPPWHASRGRIAELASALGLATGAVAKIANDIVLLAQDEVGEVRESGAGGRSSAMPSKRNPARAVQAVACAHRVPALVASVLAGMVQEHERSAGAWQAGWETLCDLLCLADAAVAHIGASLDGLEVDIERMRANLEANLGPPDPTHLEAAAAMVDAVLSEAGAADLSP